MDKLRANLPGRIKVGGKYVGNGEPNFIIAEIGNNHNGEIELAKKAVILAGQLGADAVKFQKREVDEVFIKAMLAQPQTNSRALGKTYGEYRKKQELRDDELKELKTLAHSLGMSFFVTPFDIKSAKILAGIGMDCWKIASFDLHHRDLLEFVAKQEQPIFFSTGMATLEEMDEAVKTILQYNKNLIINHCVSIYPTPNADLNLGAISMLKERYAPLPIGYSGHEVGLQTTYAAVVLGACYVERHITLDRAMWGSDHAASVEPPGFMRLVRDIRVIESAMGDGVKRVYDSELPVMKRLRRV